jgi:hypothetical protein
VYQPDEAPTGERPAGTGTCMPGWCTTPPSWPRPRRPGRRSCMPGPATPPGAPPPPPPPARRLCPLGHTHPRAARRAAPPHPRRHPRAAATPRPAGAAKKAKKSSVTCDTCFSECPAAECTSMDCGHAFCNDCWRRYIRVKVDDGNARSVTCMAFKCGVSCDEDKVVALLRGDEQVRGAGERAAWAAGCRGGEEAGRAPLQWLLGDTPARPPACCRCSSATSRACCRATWRTTPRSASAPACPGAAAQPR